MEQTRFVTIAYSLCIGLIFALVLTSWRRARAVNNQLKMMRDDEAKTP